MAKSLSASKKVMKNYLSELLTEVDLPVNQDVQTTKQHVQPTIPVGQPEKIKDKSLEKLLNTVKPSIEEVITKKPTAQPEKKETVKAKPVDTIKPVTTHKSLAQKQESKAKEKSYREGSFQAMFFDVAGLMIAVPLIELGGIHKVHKTNSLMGKPDWFKGVMLHRDEKINVVDTALWVMPEKCDDKLINSLNYQYVIMLNESHWGLMAEHLVDTVTLNQDEVKWLDSSSKRPWLAGLVKEKMCALLDVDALIKLLNDGSGIHQNK